MSEHDELGRIKSDLDVMQRAMGLRVSFGNGVLAVGIVLTMTSIAAALVSLRLQGDGLQMALFGTIAVLAMIALFLRHRRADVAPDTVKQVALSVSIYAAVWVAACGYAIASTIGATIGTARNAGLYAGSITLLLGFSVLLIRAAVKSRENRYCLGLALSTLLAGMLLPIAGHDYSYTLAHGFMAVGFAAAVFIQYKQLRETGSHHAAH